jgi:hypothetical protein
VTEAKGLLDGIIAAGAEAGGAAVTGLAEAFPDEPLEGPVSPKLNFIGPVEPVEVPVAAGAAAMD